MEETYFKKGAEVEISCNDEGFRGAWYAGIVVRTPNKTNTTVFVQYNNLIANENASKPLRELVDAVQLRPRAPIERSRIFRFSEEVDAYYNDGWWEGVITDVLDDGRCSVFFRGSREQLYFQQSDLRLHREWVYGKWVPPLEEEKPHILTKEKPKSRNKTFKEGRFVEVSSDEDGFQGAWFCACVLKCLGDEKFLVEYLTLRTDDDNEFLREEVDGLHLRPCPPQTVVLDRFMEHDEVDARYNDGWWVGVIYMVLNGGSRYMVYFRGTNDMMEFKHSDLRLHQEWIDGKWVTASQIRAIFSCMVWTFIGSDHL